MDYFGWVLIAVLVFLIAVAATTKHWRWLLLGVGLAGMAACMTGCKPKDTKVVVDTRPAAKVIVKQYVPIPKDLTAPLPVKEGPLSEVIDVAKDRRLKLEQCNGRLESIGAIQGTKAPC